MIDLLVKDLDKEMTQAETAEKDAQADYETMMADSADKRKADSKSLQEKTSAKAELESSLEDHKADEFDAKKELLATLEVLKSLHVECDWLLQMFDARKEARAVLSGADYSLLQMKTHLFSARA